MYEKELFVRPALFFSKMARLGLDLTSADRGVTLTRLWNVNGR